MWNEPSNLPKPVAAQDLTKNLNRTNLIGQALEHSGKFTWRKQNGGLLVSGGAANLKRIGLFGGSFDPVHLGHLFLARAAREELELERLFFIPTAQSPFKPETLAAPANERLRLLRLALAAWEWCEVDDQETRRGGISYSVDTVRNFARRYPGAE